MLNEISQEVKDKYHMLSPLSGTWSTKQTREQNRTRDIEIKNKLTVTRGEWDGDNGGKKQKGHQGPCIKDPKTKTMAGIQCGREEWAGPGRGMGKKGGQL